MLEHLPRLEDIPLINQRVLVRADLDLAVNDEGNVAEDWRLRRILPTLQYIVEQEGRLIIAGHRGDPRGKVRPNASLEPVGAELAKLTGWEVRLPDTPTSDAARHVIAELRSGQVCLLENLRFEPGEDRVDEGFAHALARLCDVYVLDSLSLVDRELASVVALPRAVRTRTIGLSLRADLDAIERLKAPPGPVVSILGGRRLSDQLERFEMLMDRSQVICVGGGVANTLLTASGYSLGKTKVEEDMLAQARALLERAERAKVKVVLPSDALAATRPAGTRRPVGLRDVPEGELVVDIGPKTIERFTSLCESAATIIAAGPLGLPGPHHHTEGELALYGNITQLARPPAALAPDDEQLGRFVVLLGTSAVSAARSVAAEEGPFPFALMSPAAEPVWRLIRGVRLPGLLALR